MKVIIKDTDTLTVTTIRNVKRVVEGERFLKVETNSGDVYRYQYHRILSMEELVDA